MQIAETFDILKNNISVLDKKEKFFNFMGKAAHIASGTRHVKDG
jgi:hypothetical protein